MSLPLVVDTGGWLLALSGDREYAEVLEEASTVYVPPLVLAEVDYHLRHRRREMWQLLDDLSQSPYVLESLTAADLDRAAQIDRKFRDVGLGLTDASVVALAERIGVHRVLTTDSDLAVVRFGPGWKQHLELPVPPIGDARPPVRRKK